MVVIGIILIPDAGVRALPIVERILIAEGVYTCNLILKTAAEAVTRRKLSWSEAFACEIGQESVS